VSVSKPHAFRHQRESEYHKLLSVSEVTIVVEVWGEVVAVATFRVGTRLAGYGTDCHVSKMFSALPSWSPCHSLLLSSTHLSLDLPTEYESQLFVCCMHQIYSISMMSGSVRGYRYTWFELILQDVPQMCCWALYTLLQQAPKITHFESGTRPVYV